MADTRTNPKLEEAMVEIVGCHLSSVTFVADYVQFAFDGPVLSAYTLPILSLGSQRIQWGEAGYRDPLCEQIGRRVRQVRVDDQHVSVLFEGGAAISISLLDKDYIAPEALEFSLSQERRWVV